MSPFWNGFFEHLRSCGRSGGIFFLALVSFLSLSIFARAFHNPDSVAAMTLAVAGIILLSLIRAGTGFWQMRSGKGRLRLPRLSDDELRVARARLKNQGRN